MPKNTANELVSHLFSVMRLIREHTQKRHKMDPFSALQIEVLHYVSYKKNPTMKEISEYLCVTPPAATSMVDSLVKAKKLARTADEKDRRVIRLAVTEKGKKEFSDLYKEKADRVKMVFSSLNEKEQKEFIKILKKISKAYE